MINNAQEMWKANYREWKATKHLRNYSWMREYRREAALERALAAANRRAERAEKLRDFAIEELEYAANMHLRDLVRISELEKFIPVVIETEPAPESELEKLE